jgi:ribosomal protein S18 acetylase RimI-like enzyme
MYSISIQKTALNEVEALQEISRLTFYETFAAVNTRENMSLFLENDLSLERLSEELSNPNSEFYFAFCEDEVIGYLKINYKSAQNEHKTANSIEIERIYVKKMFLGKKVGKSLLEHAFDLSKQNQLDFIWLGVWEENQRAIHFYKQFDFEEYDKHVFMLGKDSQTDILMKRKLAHF